MSACVCGETSCRNCPEHSEPGESEPDLEYACPPCWVRDCDRRDREAWLSARGGDPMECVSSTTITLESNPVPAGYCPHARSSWQMCPHCLGLNSLRYVEGAWSITGEESARD